MTEALEFPPSIDGISDDPPRHPGERLFRALQVRYEQAKWASLLSEEEGGRRYIDLAQPEAWDESDEPDELEEPPKFKLRVIEGRSDYANKSLLQAEAVIKAVVIVHSLEDLPAQRVAELSSDTADRQIMKKRGFDMRRSGLVYETQRELDLARFSGGQLIARQMQEIVPALPPGDRPEGYGGPWGHMELERRLPPDHMRYDYIAGMVETWPMAV